MLLRAPPASPPSRRHGRRAQDAFQMRAWGGEVARRAGTTEAMRRRGRDRPARRLRVSTDALPRATKLAMLEGIRETPIIAGAYTSSEGTCPMLAAHRRGGRTS